MPISVHEIKSLQYVLIVKAGQNEQSGNGSQSNREVNEQSGNGEEPTSSGNRSSRYESEPTNSSNQSGRSENESNISGNRYENGAYNDSLTDPVDAFYSQFTPSTSQQTSFAKYVQSSDPPL